MVRRRNEECMRERVVWRDQERGSGGEEEEE